MAKYDQGGGCACGLYEECTCNLSGEPLKSKLKQEGGSHYKNMAIQPYEYCHRNKLGHLESNVVKYVSRWREKGGLEDIRKAIHTLEYLIELEEANT